MLSVFATLLFVVKCSATLEDATFAQTTRLLHMEEDVNLITLGVEDSEKAAPVDRKGRETSRPSSAPRGRGKGFVEQRPERPDGPPGPGPLGGSSESDGSTRRNKGGFIGKSSKQIHAGSSAWSKAFYLQKKQQHQKQHPVSKQQAQKMKMMVAHAKDRQSKRKTWERAVAARNLRKKQRKVDPALNLAMKKGWRLARNKQQQGKVLRMSQMLHKSNQKFKRRVPQGKLFKKSVGKSLLEDLTKHTKAAAMKSHAFRWTKKEKVEVAADGGIAVE